MYAMVCMSSCTRMQARMRAHFFLFFKESTSDNLISKNKISRQLKDKGGEGPMSENKSHSTAPQCVIRGFPVDIPVAAGHRVSLHFCHCAWQLFPILHPVSSKAMETSRWFPLLPGAKHAKLHPHLHGLGFLAEGQEVPPA